MDEIAHGKFKYTFKYENSGFLMSDALLEYELKDASDCKRMLSLEGPTGEYINIKLSQVFGTIESFKRKGNVFTLKCSILANKITKKVLESSQLFIAAYGHNENVNDRQFVCFYIGSKWTETQKSDMVLLALRKEINHMGINQLCEKIINMNPQWINDDINDEKGWEQL